MTAPEKGNAKVDEWNEENKGRLNYYLSSMQRVEPMIRYKTTKKIRALTIGSSAPRAYERGVEFFVLFTNIFSIHKITSTKLPLIKDIISFKSVLFIETASFTFFLRKLCQRL